MRKSLCTKIAVCLCFLITTLVAAVDSPATTDQTEPTKEQTIDYILARINEVQLKDGTGSVRTKSKTVKLIVKHFQYATIEDCLLTIRETRLENDVLMLDKTYKVPLAQLNPADVKADAQRVFLITANDGFFVDQTVKSRRNAKAESVDHKMTDKVPVNFAMGQGEKLARAFSHLIKLCGGQKDLF
jgi:preprotein translocase subunit Sec63